MQGSMKQEAPPSLRWGSSRRLKTGINIKEKKMSNEKNAK